MRAQLQCQLLFVITTVDRNCLKTHAPRVLNSEMSESSNAVHSNDVSGART